MVVFDTRTSRVLFTALLFALGVGFLYVARHTLIVFLFAIFFAYLMEPAVSRLEKWLHGRGRAIGVIYALLLVGLALFFFSVGPRIGREAARLGQSLPDLLTRVSSGAIARDIGKEHGWSSATQEKIRELLTTNPTRSRVMPSVSECARGSRQASLADPAGAAAGNFLSERRPRFQQRGAVGRAGAAATRIP